VRDLRLPKPPPRYDPRDEAETRRLIELALLRDTPGQGGAGLESRREVTLTTASLANGAEETGTIDIGAPGVRLLKIESDRACWFRPYPTAATRTLDEDRSQDTDPPTGRVFADFIWLTAHEKIVTPPVDLFNADSSVAEVIYYSVKNISGTTGTITLTLTVVSNEA
jgi:hypothetical protein